MEESVRRFYPPALGGIFENKGGKIENNGQTPQSGVISAFNTETHCTTIAYLSGQKLPKST